MHTRSIVGVGHSLRAKAFDAATEAAEKALSAIGKRTPVFAIVYGTVLYDQQELLRAVRKRIPQALIVGSSTQGISRLGAVEEVDRVVAVAVLASETIEARAFCVRELSKDPIAAGRELAGGVEGFGQSETPMLLWYDPLTGVNVEAFLQGLEQGGVAQVIGGGAGQPWGPVHKTYQYFGEEALHDSAVGLKLTGCSLRHGLTHGTEPLGLELTITDAAENVIKEIDGRPALDIWNEQLGFVESGVDHGSPFDVNDTAAWAIGVRLPEEYSTNYEGPITRAVFGINADTREIILQAPLKSGTKVQLCHRTPHAVLDRALEMGRRVRAQISDLRPLMALSFECAARPRPFLGDSKALEEVTKLQEVLGDQIPWIGMYAWGEVAPILGRSFFHNYTFPLCVICEDIEVGAV